MYGPLYGTPVGHLAPPFLSVERLANGYVATYQTAIPIEPPHVETPRVENSEMQAVLGVAAGLMRQVERHEQRYEIVTQRIFCETAPALLDALAQAEAAWPLVQEATRGERIRCG